MNVIYKYPLHAYPEEIYLPAGAQFLSVQTQHDVPQMWFVVEQDQQEKESRKFVARATGTPFEPSDNEYFLGTFQLQGGRLVFHVFEQLV